MNEKFYNNDHILQVEGTQSPILKVSNITKAYGSKFAVKDISFEVLPGKIIGLLGPNGSGKTTIIKLISGLLTSTSGEISVMGHAPGIISKTLVSYLPEQSYLDENMTAREAIELFSDFYADFDVSKAIDMLGSLKIDNNMKLKKMSKGTKEKVQLILVMSRSAKLYLLDEPIGGVDPASRDYILNTILTNYSPKSSIIISTHLISDIERVLDDVLFISNGEIFLQSTVDDIRSNKGQSVDEFFREVFRC